jgi:hypothetical protein
LVAEFELLDDFGSINVEITTEADHNAKGSLIYRPPNPDFYSLDYFEKNKPTKKLFDFLQQEDGKEFSFHIKNTRGQIVYWSDPLRLLIE